jgi:hypothetical protein
MLVVAIDVGIKNLSYCAIQDGRILEWSNVSLVEGTYRPSDSVHYVKRFTEAHADLLDAADVVVVEKQMRANMRIIESVLHALYYSKCKAVHARTIKARFGLSRPSYRLNKRAAVDYVAASVDQEPWIEYFQQSVKKDDLADSYLMALFMSEEGRIKNTSTHFSKEAVSESVSD